MHRRKTIVRSVAVMLLFSVLLGGCKTRTKSTKRERSEAERAEAMLDDFCAYLKIGRLDRVSNLVAGNSQGLADIMEYSRSEASVVFDAALQRIDYKIKDVDADAASKKGTGTLDITYFDTSSVGRKSENGNASNDYKSSIEQADSVSLPIDVNVVYENDSEWKLEEASADTVFDKLFSFIDELGLGTQATEPTTSVDLPPYRVFNTAWYDSSFAEVAIVHESDKHLFYFVTTWDYYNNTTMTYKFTDENGNVLAEGEEKMGINDDLIECELDIQEKIPIGTLWCHVYGPDGKLFTEGHLKIVSDDTELDNEFGIVSIGLVDASGELVPGYTVGENEIRAKVICSAPLNEIDLGYELYTEAEYIKNGALLCQGRYAVMSNIPSNQFDIPVNEVKDLNLAAGKYVLLIRDPQNHPFVDLHFQMIKEGGSFENDAPTATLKDSYWALPQSVTKRLDSIKPGTAQVDFFFSTQEECQCMQFPYKVTAKDGTVLAEGTAMLLFYESTAKITVDIPEGTEGEITCTVLNPDQSELISSTIEVKE